MGFLDIDQLSKSYGSTKVLHDVNIDVDEGEFLVLVGPSGCGKSTLLNMIAGLESITSGELRIKGEPMNGVHPSKRNIAMVFQSYALYPNMNVAQNITFGMEMHGIDKEIRQTKLDEVSKLLQIDHLLDRKPGQLSGGQRQRVAMGRALVRDPDVFLFDEPLSNLDAKLRVDMRTEIKKLHQRLGRTIVYVTHDQIEALTLSTRIAVMNGGYVQQLGTPHEIYNNPANMFVASFMGSPSMNLIPAKLIPLNKGWAVEVEGSSGNHQLALSTSDNFEQYANQDVILGLRPEALTDAESADSKAVNTATFENLVAVTEPAGADTFVTTNLGGKDCIARMRADIDVAPNTSFPFVANMDKAVLFDPQTQQRI